MADLSPNGQDLAKALDNVGSTSPTSAYVGSSATANSTASSVPPPSSITATPASSDYAAIVPANSPVAPAAVAAASPATSSAPLATSTDTQASQPMQATTDMSSTPNPYAAYAANTGTTVDTTPIATSTSSLGSSSSTDTSGSGSPLDAIKKDALDQLRPLVDKLGVAPEEKFDTYLLLIRSTDDKNLVSPAYEAAKAIPDEARRAEALLDIIKEIDYLSHPKSGS